MKLPLAQMLRDCIARETDDSFIVGCASVDLENILNQVRFR
jgi:hypothetical protein